MIVLEHENACLYSRISSLSSQMACLEMDVEEAKRTLECTKAALTAQLAQEKSAFDSAVKDLSDVLDQECDS